VSHEQVARQTLPGLLLERVRRTPDEVAFRAKELGIYRETTWRQLADRVAALALGFGELGVGRGDTVATMGDPCPELTIADLAAQALGGISYGIYSTSSASEIGYLLRHGGARVLVVETQEHLDKALAVLTGCPTLTAVAIVDTRALFMYRDERVTPLAAVEERGRRLLAAEPHALARLAAEVRPDDPATIVYTSGTTAHPKGVLLRHGAHIAAVASMLDHFPLLRAGQHRTVAFLPLSHAMGRFGTITMPMLADVVPHYPESLDSMAETVFEVSPTFVFTVPRFLQKYAGHLLVGLDASSPLKRAVYRAAMAIGRSYLDRHWKGRVPLLLAFGQCLARALVFRWLLDKIGYARTRLVISSGAPLPPAVAALWQTWGVNLLELYGQSETGVITGQQGESPRPGNVGRPAPGMRVRLGDEGEIMVASPHLFAGYWKDPESTRAAFRDEWFLTGDIGEWTAEGALRLIDRKKDFLVTAGGKNVSPAQIESGLRASPYVSEAVVFGDGRQYLVALLELDYETLAEWARSNGVLHTGYASLVSHAQVERLIEAEVTRANRALARVEQVKAFRLLPRELDPEQDGEPVTATRKVKRRLMLERYRPLIESMYSGDEERRIAAEVAALTPGVRGRSDGLEREEV
jgi:long-chain acyl-CoA synthetase